MSARSISLAMENENSSEETVLCLINIKNRKPFVLIDDMDSSAFFKGINFKGGTAEYEKDLFEVEEVEVSINELTPEQSAAIKKLNNEEMKKSIEQASTSENGDVKYSATRLTFYRRLIEPLTDNQKIVISCRDGEFVMTKHQFKDVFSNVCQSVSYKIDGNYSYAKTPGKAYQFKLRKTK